MFIKNLTFKYVVKIGLFFKIEISKIHTNHRYNIIQNLNPTKQHPIFTPLVTSNTNPPSLNRKQSLPQVDTARFNLTPPNRFSTSRVFLQPCGTWSNPTLLNLKPKNACYLRGGPLVACHEPTTFLVERKRKFCFPFTVRGPTFPRTNVRFKSITLVEKSPKWAENLFFLLYFYVRFRDVSSVKTVDWVMLGRKEHQTWSNLSLKGAEERKITKGSQSDEC